MSLAYAEQLQQLKNMNFPRGSGFQLRTINASLAANDPHLTGPEPTVQETMVIGAGLASVGEMFGDAMGTKRALATINRSANSGPDATMKSMWMKPRGPDDMMG